MVASGRLAVLIWHAIPGMRAEDLENLSDIFQTGSHALPMPILFHEP